MPNMHFFASLKNVVYRIFGLKNASTPIEIENNARPHETAHDGVHERKVSAGNPSIQDTIALQRFLPRYLTEATITLRKGDRAYRGVNFQGEGEIKPKIGHDLWVCASEVGARNYIKAFGADKVGKSLLLEFQVERDLVLVDIRLGEATKEVFMSSLIRGEPQIWQRDELLDAICKLRGQNVDGFYDHPTGELLIRSDALNFVRVFKI